jgi:hypothetical protein
MDYKAGICDDSVLPTARRCSGRVSGQQKASAKGGGFYMESFDRCLCGTLDRNVVVPVILGSLIVGGPHIGPDGGRSLS